MVQQETRSAAEDLITGDVGRAIARTREYLLGRQHPDGYWKGPLEADASVSAGYLPLMHFLGVPVAPARRERIVAAIWRQQNGDGSWSVYPGGPGDVSVTAQVYFALKLAGVSLEDKRLALARDFIVTHGGLMQTNLITRIWLALFGEFAWKGVPTVPPEISFAPNWFYLNIYECSSWARATIMALTVLTDRRPVCPIPDTAHIDELYAEPEADRDYSVGTSTARLSWETFFLAADRVFKLYHRVPVKPLRGQALRKVTDWILAHQDPDGSWGGIMLPWVYSLFALKSLGFSNDHPAMAKGITGLEGYVLEESDGFVLEPSTSPVWDTAWAVLALAESGLPGDDEALARAGRWLLGKEIRQHGDWAIKNPDTRPGGWSFEFENRQYPDIDDTAVVPRALREIRFLDPGEAVARNAAVERGIDWALAMQGDEGGWAAFDRNNNRAVLGHIPYSDFITPLDPVSPDVTNHVIELLGQYGPLFKEAMARGVEYLKQAQLPDGSWFGRWGVCYLYGTGLVLPSLQAAGEDMNADYVRRAADWLRARQNQDGGWGESCRSYDDPSCAGTGESTASQTAWALMGLIAAGEAGSEAVERGVRYLLDTQEPDGAWTETAFTGTGFPRAFYLRYDLYRVYFPLMALARYRKARGVGA